jgi:methyl-accepting chemotaxis protein
MGRYEQVVPAQGRRDEIGAIAQSVEVLRQGALERDRLEAETLNEQGRRSARGARRESVIERFSAAIGSLVDDVNANIGNMELTAQALTKMAGSTTDLASDADLSSRDSARNVQSVATAAEELARSSTEIAGKIGETNRIVLHANDAAAGANSRIKSLAEASSRIGDVVALIRGIASQTNLLALNATIEAARAGESGRGFAVVASEVKALAEQTAKATDEIARQIVSVQSETESAVQAIEAISQTMETVATYAATVAHSIDEQRRATGEISQSVQAVATGTGAVVATIGAVSATAAETTQSAGSMLQASHDLGRQASLLTDHISTFLKDLRNV